MEDAPIIFQHCGKKYVCRFSAVHGAGANVWHLNDERNFYCGRLRLARDQWVFDATPKTQELSDMGQYFGDYLTAWYR